MDIGFQVLSWRRAKRLTQGALAQQASVGRPYLSRLEQGQIDPTLSSLRKLAAALAIGLGQLLEESPEQKRLTRHEIDGLARAALRPGSKDAQSIPFARAFAQIIKPRRSAIGLFRTRKNKNPAKKSGQGRYAQRWIRAALGEDQWQAVLRRIQKLSSGYPE
jgi:transcriptional regulator with XRE-family HTH domain